MNILVFSWRDIKHPLAGGAEQVMHEHAKGWIGVGHSVTHFSSRFKDSAKTEKIDGIKLIRGGYQYLGVQFAAFFYYLKNKNDFDLVVDEFHGIPFFTPLYVNKPKMAVIQEVARKVWFLNPLPWPINWIIGTIGYLAEPFVFLFYKQSLLPWSKNVPFMTGSVSAKNDVNKMGIPMQNITIVPHGVIVDKPTSSLKKEKKFTLVYLGVISQDKGIEDALECFSLLKKKRNFQFWVIGRTETERYGNKINKLIKKLKFGKELKLWGYVSQEKKFELLSRAHLLINSSVREGWGLVNIEANAVGTPVVAYKSPGLVDSVIDGVSGLLCEENTPQSLVINVIKISKDESFYKKLIQSAQKWSRNFSWQKSAKESLKLVEKIGHE